MSCLGDGGCVPTVEMPPAPAMSVIPFRDCVVENSKWMSSQYSNGTGTAGQ